MRINLKEDFKNLIVDEAMKLGHQLSRHDEFRKVYYDYLNLYIRIPNVQKWNVQTSSHLASKLLNLSQGIQSGLNYFIQQAQNGADLRPHISKLINQISYSDMMLYDWNIYHFHLGTKIEQDGFVTRTNEIVFAMISKNEMYLLDILPHKGSFYEQDLLSIIDNEWPHLLVPYINASIIAVSHPPTNDDVKLARQSGLQTIVQLPSNKVLFPMGGGYSTSGTSVKIQMQVIRVTKHLYEIEKFIKEDKADQIKRFLGLPYTHYLGCEFELLSYNGKNISLFEKTTKTQIDL